MFLKNKLNFSVSFGKKFTLLLSLTALLLSFSGCYHEEITYDNPSDNSKIIDLTEIREKESLEIFPKNIDKNNTDNYYFNWELDFVGSASVEYFCSVKYNKDDYHAEIQRLENFKATNTDESLHYDESTFCFPAYVAVLGYYDTNAYALVDENEHTIHYIYISLVRKNQLKLDNAYLPDGYTDLGNVNGQSYSICSKL